ncbi:MAG: hypothetical protein HKN08_01730 [Gammaproteobacteria bacterium]|nr:hypothetical protein [Gammaproteobacteria bacterium]
MADPTQVDAADPSKKNSEILGPTSDEATVQMSDMEQTCFWNDMEYQQGHQLESDGKKYECSFGKWVPID